MIRFNMMGWAYGYNNCKFFSDCFFESEEELEDFLKDSPDIKFDDEAWEMLSDEYKEKFKKHKNNCVSTL